MTDPDFRERCNFFSRRNANKYYQDRKTDPEYVEKIRTRSRENNRKYRLDPEKYKKQLERSRAWKLENPAKVNSINARRKAHMLRACPQWVDISAIESLYVEAINKSNETGIPHAVDHFVPLISKFVCGLHVPWNLRVITQSENSSKGNKLIC